MEHGQMPVLFCCAEQQRCEKSMKRKGESDLKEELLKLFYERYAPEQTYEYLRHDPVYQEKEKELKEAVATFEPVIKALGRENWHKYDRILTAHNSCEAYALQRIHLKGIQDALEMCDALNREEENGGK